MTRCNAQYPPYRKCLCHKEPGHTGTHRYIDQDGACYEWGAETEDKKWPPDWPPAVDEIEVPERPRPATKHVVTGCNSCDFCYVVEPNMHCALADRWIGDFHELYLRPKHLPDWCPLRESDVLLTLRLEEKK